MNTDRKALRGIIPAVITPMNEHGRVDEKALHDQVRYLSDAGVHGFFVGGTTGEGAFLGTEELRESFRIAREASRGRQFLCLASLRPSTSQVLEELPRLLELEPDYLVIIAPYYLAMRQPDILAHFRAVLDVSSVPVIVYNIPSSTHNPIAVETVLELARDARVAGTKDSSGDFISFSRGVLTPVRDGFTWVQGEDYLFGPSFMMGAQGAVTGLGNVEIEPYLSLMCAVEHADWAKVRQCQARINRLYGIIRAVNGRTLPAIKAAVSIQGRCEPWTRQRSMNVSREDLGRVEKALREAMG